MILSNCSKKIPEYLFYSQTLNKEKSIESHRMINSKTGKYLGEIITYPQDFYYFNLEVPGLRSLYIDRLSVFNRNKGFGTKFLNFARVVSKQKGCNGRLHLISSDCYDKEKPPHIFYRKYGFDSRDLKKLEEVDDAISQPNKKFTFNSIAMFFPPKPQVEGIKSSSKSLWTKLKQFFRK